IGAPAQPGEDAGHSRHARTMGCPTTLRNSPRSDTEPSMTIKAYGAHAGDQPLVPLDITRRPTGPEDVRIDIAYCGVCHSDLHQVRAEWAGTVFPCVPGHEIVGRVAEVGAGVTRFK